MTVADTSEPEMPDVQLIGQVDIQMQKDKVCRGAAFLQDHMYLIYDDVNTVYVHSNDPPYIPLNQVVVDEMKDPGFIVASVEHNCVYIAEYGKIWRLLRNNKECETFLDDMWHASISVTEEGHLLVATNFEDDDLSFVSTYDADGRCIQLIGIQQEISYAVKLGATKLFVKCSYREKRPTMIQIHWFGWREDSYALSEVSLNGVVLHTYGPYFNDYFKCCGMTMGEDGQIFVIDKANGGRILVFGSRARLIGVLLNKDDHQITKLTGLCYIKDKKQLVVTGSDHINIYQLSKNEDLQMDGPGLKAASDVENPVFCSRHGDSGQLLFARGLPDDDDYPVKAIAKLEGKIYLLHDTSVAVFSTQDLVRKVAFGNKGIIKIPDDRNFNIVDLWDIAASEVDLCLYVTDRYNHCVWSVTIAHKIKKWLTNIGSPYTLSVTEDGCLCILSNDYKSLDIYDRSGNRKKSIRLPLYMKYLLHAVQTPKETYVVCWTLKRQSVIGKWKGEEFVEIKSNTKKGQENQNDDTDAETGDEEERRIYDDEDAVFEERHENCVCSGDSETQTRGLICEVSSDGEILRSFSANNPQPAQINTSDSSHLYQLNKPCHLAVDQEGRVFVADNYRCNTVLLLDSQLKFLANLTEKFPVEDNKAKRLFYDKNTKELTVLKYRPTADEIYFPPCVIMSRRMQCQ